MIDTDLAARLLGAGLDTGTFGPVCDLLAASWAELTGDYAEYRRLVERYGWSFAGEDDSKDFMWILKKPRKADYAVLAVAGTETALEIMVRHGTDGVHRETRMSVLPGREPNWAELAETLRVAVQTCRDEAAEREKARGEAVIYMDAVRRTGVLRGGLERVGQSIPRTIIIPRRVYVNDANWWVGGVGRDSGPAVGDGADAG